MNMRILALAFSAAMAAIPVLARATAISGPSDVWFGFAGTLEFVVLETPYVFRIDDDRIRAGDTTLVEHGVAGTELRVGARFTDFPDPSSAFGRIFSVGGTRAAARVSDPLTAATQFAPFSIRVEQSSAELHRGAGAPGEWTGAGTLNAEGVTFEDDFLGNTIATSGVSYSFEIEGIHEPGGASTATAAERLVTFELQGSLPLVDGQFWLETQFISIFEGSLADVRALPVSIPEPGVLALAAIGLAGIGWSRRRRAG